MSFTVDIINELVGKTHEKTCCKKAFVFGLFFGAEKLSKSEVRAEFKTEESADLAVSLLKKQFTAEPSLEPIVRAGRRMFWVTVSSKALSFYLDKIDREDNVTNEEFDAIIGFRCDDCKKAFLAGVFITSGISTDPESRYSLEFGIKSEIRAAWLSAFVCANVGDPRCVDRRSKIGLYYRGDSQVAYILAYMGAVVAHFKVINTCMEKDMKNDENRAINCVLKNIEKSVSAARRHIEAIEALKANGQFEIMSDELKYTAQLRCDFPSATLAELAELHEPAISKSGLNRRLEKILSLVN